MMMALIASSTYLMVKNGKAEQVNVTKMQLLKSLILFVPAYPFKVEAAELALFRIMHHHDLMLLTLHAIQPFQDHY